ncbi:DUF488 family protein [Paraburkholderia phosphatilytica]|uniref:DUF488 domain-containing protein n=1 Tax=Paraburkholderia phosphatilytica TaxID=2282883 RepID=UPI000E4A7AD3|nr:DUF488 domain-containing protein [Paraburkholderia phosphatilytica]
MTLFTIGYEGLDTERFLSLLIEHGVETVVDVREMPWSRKPGFSKKPLAGLLAMRGLSYVHMVKLGCPKPIRDGHHEDHDWQRYTERYLTHLGKQGETIAELCALAETSTCALLCYEADYNDCHRSMVANAVHERSGARVEHIRALAPQPPTSLRLPFED